VKNKQQKKKKAQKLQNTSPALEREREAFFKDLIGKKEKGTEGGSNGKNVGGVHKES